MDIDSRVLISEWRKTGSEDVAAELVRRYAARLLTLARQRICGQLSRRLDAEDVLQSVYRTFFSRVRDGRIESLEGKTLWSLLATITMCKLFGQMEHHLAAKRCVRREDAGTNAAPFAMNLPDAIADEPSPDHLAALDEEWRAVRDAMLPLHQTILERHLDGWTVEEIAQSLNRTDRTVRHVLQSAETQLARRLQSVRQ